jgi:maleylacetate reductase
MQFLYTAHQSRVIFGSGTRARVPEELDRLGISRAAVLATPVQADLAAEFARDIGARAALVYPGAAMHTPTNVTMAALLAVESAKANGILSVGGGSTVGLGKAIALRTGMPHLAVATTFAGSEMTPILGETENGVKTTQRTPQVLPQTVVYDPDLVATMPVSIAGPSGMNAIAHAVEALYAEDGNPIISMMGEEAIRALAESLPRIVTSPQNKDAWTKALYGAWLGGICLGAVAMGIHHKICHTLGGAFELDHASIHCLMIPYTAAYNHDAVPEAMRRAARALSASNAPDALYDLMTKTATKKTLREFGLTESDLEKAADLAVKNPYYSPRPVSRDGILEMLHAAYEGSRPPVASYSHIPVVTR